jgi:crotonobetainyl-CoA:carnitine CoA-transferase CaiB-like acyl-CoA transferase
MRSIPPFTGDTSAGHGLLNRSKRSIALNLKKPGAIAVVKRMVQTYDIVLEQFRPGVMDRLGVGYEALSAVNPQLIYCAISGYGQTGPYINRAGHDINFLALSGIASYTGRKGQAPLPVGVQVADIGGGSYNAMVGILAAVIHRQLTGEGQLVDVSLFDGTIAWNAIGASSYFVSGADPEPEGTFFNGGSVYDYYQTSDGRFLSVASLEPKFWGDFCEALGRPDLLEYSKSYAPDVQLFLKVEIQKTIGARSYDTWVEIFGQVDVCVEPVLRVSEMAQHPQTAARKMIVNVPDGEGTTQQQIGNPIKFSRFEPAYKHIGSALGAHTAEVLLEAGFSTAEIETLRAAEVFG